MATSIHEKMGFEIQVIDMSISPSPQGAKLEIHSRKPHYYETIIYFKNDWCQKNWKTSKWQTNLESSNTIIVIWSVIYSTSDWKILFTFTTTA